MSPILIQLLLALGGTLGETLVTSPALQRDIALAITTSQQLIAALTGKTKVASAVFITVLQAAFAVLQQEGKLTTVQAAALQDAISKTLAADHQAQILVDPGTLTPIEPLP